MIRRYLENTSLTGHGACRIYVRFNTEKETYNVSIMRVQPANRARPLFKTQYTYGGRLQPMLRDKDLPKDSPRIMRNVIHEAVLDFFMASSDKPLQSNWPTF